MLSRFVTTVELDDAVVLHLHHIADELAYVAILVGVAKRLGWVSEKSSAGIGVEHVPQLLAATRKLSQCQWVDVDRCLGTASFRIDSDVLGVKIVALASTHDIVDIGETVVVLKQLVALELLPGPKKNPPLPSEADTKVGDTLIDPVIKTESTESQYLPHVALRHS